MKNFLNIDKKKTEYGQQHCLIHFQKWLHHKKYRPIVKPS